MAVNKESCDWRDGKCLSECMIHMLENKIMCDVTFTVGKNKTQISAHKYMLSSRSPVFHTMFEGSLPEKQEINIPEIETTTFKTMLRYIYSDKLEISNDNVEEMLYAADKYMLAGMKRECENVMNQTATTEHAAKTLHIACIYNLSDLQQESLKHIESNTKLCLSSDHALNLPKESLEIILLSDFLDCAETDICSFFLDWANHKCGVENLEPTGENLRKVAGTLLYLIRFPIVDMKYFSNEVSQTGLLGYEEIVSIYQSHFGKRSKMFGNRSRCPVSKRPTYTLSRYGSIASPWENQKVEAICFIADTNIWIKGVTIFYPIRQYYSYNYNSLYHSYSVVIEILDDTNIVLNSAETQIGYSGDNYMYGEPSSCTIKFQEATRITARHKYTLKMTGEEFQSYYGADCKKSVTENGVTIKFENSPICSNCTTTETGQFGEILFSA